MQQKESGRGKEKKKRIDEDEIVKSELIKYIHSYTHTHISTSESEFSSFG